MMSPRERAAKLGFESTIYSQEAESSIGAVARSRGLLVESFLGLTPQALCRRLLRRLITNLNSLVNSNVSRDYREEILQEKTNP